MPYFLYPNADHRHGLFVLLIEVKKLTIKESNHVYCLCKILDWNKKIASNISANIQIDVSEEVKAVLNEEYDRI
jgi:sulfur relay (sulfurtransferase) DsrC/TusE family protein